MTDHEHDHEVPLRTRTVGFVQVDEDTFVAVDHVYLPDEAAGSCDHCGGQCHDPGLVGLLVEDESGSAGALLTPEDALALINRLTRAVNLVYEAEEQRPDLDREAARLGVAAELP